MKKQKLKVRKMNQFGNKWEQLTIPKEDGGQSWFNCHTGEWKKGFVQFIPDVIYNIDHYRVVVGDNELVGQEHWVAVKDKAHWQKTFEQSGFEVRYIKEEKKTKKIK
jgi:hypothetical protein